MFDGRRPHSSGVFNDDRWSLVLFAHSSWEHVSPATRKQLLAFGLPCPPPGATTAAPAIDGAVVSDDSDVAPPKVGLLEPDVVPPKVGLHEPEVVPPKVGLPAGTREEANSVEHLMTHMPKNPFCTICSVAKIQRKQKRRKTSKLVPDEVARPPPTKFGEQVTGCLLYTSDAADE